MRVSEECVSEIKAAEGFRSQAYPDAVGVWTIGYGSTAGVKAGDRITEVEADRRLRLHVAAIERTLPLDVSVTLTQGQFDALVDFEYNLGRGALDHSTLLELLNRGDYSGAAAQFPRWCHAGDTLLPGLLKRRLQEQSWFTRKAA
jgi:lysozyme